MATYLANKPSLGGGSVVSREARALDLERPAYLLVEVQSV